MVSRGNGTANYPPINNVQTAKIDNKTGLRKKKVHAQKKERKEENEPPRSVGVRGKTFCRVVHSGDTCARNIILCTAANRVLPHRKTARWKIAEKGNTYSGKENGKGIPKKKGVGHL